ncbi:MAG TPA: LLM class F420-dependent oxidoreductase [Solirubrobacteraceae bacterium]
MHIGILSNSADWSLDPAATAQLVEAAGIESLFLGEHSHVPASRESPYPGDPEGVLPAGYERTYDLFVALTAAALATTELRVGSGICQLVQRDPILTAKAVASLDHLSGGRVVLVVGASWNLEEMRNHGTDPDTRYQLLEERAQAMREIWASDEASYHGDFVNFDRIWSWPKPAQDPMPIFIGGNSPEAEARALRSGTGWAPLHIPGLGVPERIRAYTEQAAADGVTTSALGVGGELSAELIEEYADAGAERWLHYIPMTGDAGEFERELERLLAVHGEFIGAA